MLSPIADSPVIDGPIAYCGLARERVLGRLGGWLDRRPLDFPGRPDTRPLDSQAGSVGARFPSLTRESSR